MLTADTLVLCPRNHLDVASKLSFYKHLLYHTHNNFSCATPRLPLYNYAVTGVMQWMSEYQYYYYLCCGRRALHGGARNTGTPFSLSLLLPLLSRFQSIDALR